MKLRTEVCEKIIKDKDLRLDLMQLFKVTEGRTIRAMIKRNDPDLMRMDALEAISRRTGITTSKLIEV